MLGYISPEKPELKIKEYEIYSGYYCGICKSIGKRYGQIPRLALSYDSVFLALLFTAAYSVNETASIERCIIHPVKKRTIINQNSAIDFAADMFLILMFFKLKDDERDGGSLKSKAGIQFGKGTFAKLKHKYPKKISLIEEYLNQLNVLEDEKNDSIDKAAEPFSKLTEIVFSSEENEFDFYDMKKDKIMKSIGYYLGKWLYLIDALDDIDEDIINKNYNPIKLKFNFEEKKESLGEFRERIKDRMEFNLLSYLAEIAKAYDLLEAKKNQALLDNIIYFGLMKKTENILMKGSNDSNG
ncbi:MAG: DUF5685 family protein [Eubacteriales bacterium]